MSAEQLTKTVGYIRVASGSARKREGSVYIQRKAILEYAKISGMQVVRFFADHECIADITQRQGLSDALAYIACGKAQALAVASLDRLSSSVRTIVGFVSQHRFLAGGPALVSVKEGLDTRPDEGRAALGVMAALTRWESETQRGEA
ncbi:recombinase family protein [Haliangium sp. UPWRP_2]|uniref:recombinase family protein n=1 Tax=Haliangium sp. UPWRP_2 TaxID=1931276 RepID=UPI000D0E0633|nr:recombinase family protein [Haliangium sp. UPWRP_2]PSM31412.1 hypothetical protein BVG81_005565 [Haliangium sp. UPWRP_2]